MDEYASFHQRLLEWYEENGRVFYWRTDELSTFHLLITELLLKRTQAEIVDNHAKNVLDQLPTPRAALEYDREFLVELLRPFGLYNRRSKNIQNVCRDLVTRHDGHVPSSREELLDINGIGQYSADAVLCFAYDQPVILLDTNITSVAEGFFGVSTADDPRLDRMTRPTLEPLLEFGNPKQTNWALLDLGADMIRYNKTSDDYTIPNIPKDDINNA